MRLVTTVLRRAVSLCRCFFCNWVDANGNLGAPTPGSLDGTATSYEELTCETPDWGSSFVAAEVELSITKLDAAGEPVLVAEETGRARKLFLEEDIFALSETTLNAFGHLVFVSGSGFSTTPGTYSCFVFELTIPAPPHASSTTTGYQDLNPLAESVFEAFNTTSGRCIFKSMAQAQATKVTLVKVSTAFDSFRTVYQGQRQPLISSVDGTNMLGALVPRFTFKTLDVVFFESWATMSILAGLDSGGEDLTVVGAGFKPVQYTCVFTVITSGANSCDNSAQPTLDVSRKLIVNAVRLSAQELKCVTPSWVATGYTDNVATTDFTIVRNDALVVHRNSLVPVRFEFLHRPTWLTAPDEDTVFVEGANCGALDVQLQANGGLAPLRIMVEYTPLRPRARESFVQWDNEAPTADEVLRRTDELPKQIFLDEVLLDTHGRDVFCLGNSTFNLQLPKGDLPMTQTREGNEIGLYSNALQPSKLLWESSTSRTDSNMQGMLRFNFSLGWEGYAYKVCVTARQAPVAPSVTSAAYFNTRCFYVVVPKCRKCFGPTDTLYGIAHRYQAQWLDLWSINKALVNTTKSNPATDEVFNLPGDQVYPLVALGADLRLGAAYRITGSDTLLTIARRFGMRMVDLMRLNPDVAGEQQNTGLDGKLVCFPPPFPFRNLSPAAFHARASNPRHAATAMAGAWRALTVQRFAGVCAPTSKPP